jgi:hypothetical protein
VRYPVPEVIAAEPDLVPLGRPLLILERIHGPLLGWTSSPGAAESKPETLARLRIHLHRRASRRFTAAELRSLSPGPISPAEIESWRRLAADDLPAGSRTLSHS